MQYYHLLTAFILFCSTFASNPSGPESPEGKSVLLCASILCSDYFTTEPEVAVSKTRAFSDWETVPVDEVASQDCESSTAKSPESQDEPHSFALDSLKRILGEKCLPDLKLWLRKYSDAKKYFLEVGVSLQSLLITFDFDEELISLILDRIGDDSVEFWLKMLKMVDFFLSNSRPEAVQLIIEKSIALGKTDQHFRTLFFRILKAASQLVFVSQLLNSHGRLYSSPYSVVSVLAGKCHAFPGYERLFQSLLRGSYSAYELSRVFFFEPSIQVDIIKSYLSNGGQLTYNGIIKYNMISNAIEASIDARAFELIIEADKARNSESSEIFPDLSRNSSSSTESMPLRDSVLEDALEFAVETENAAYAQVIVRHHPDLSIYLQQMMATISLSQVASDPFWIECLREIDNTFESLRHGRFTQREVFLLCVTKDKEERNRFVPFLLNCLRRSFEDPNLRSNCYSAALRMVLQYSADGDYSWAAELLKDCRTLAPTVVQNLLIEAQQAHNASQVAFLRQE